MIFMWNYGKKGRGRPFKKGEKPWNAKPVGAERVTEAGFVQIKVAQPDCWKFKHLVAWEKAHGPLPEDREIDFIDGDRQNVSLENLRLRPPRSLIGDERVGSKGLVEVKVSANRWRLKHIVIWEEAHGPLPKTHVLYFVDGDRFNFDLANLVPFPKNGRLENELARLRPRRRPETFGLSLELMARLKRQIECGAAAEAMKISDELLFAQLEYLNLTSGGFNVPYRH